MKKFMKGCGITAAVLIIVGFILSVVTVGVRGSITYRDLVNALTHGRVDDENWYIWENRFFDRFGERLADKLEYGFERFEGSVEAGFDIYDKSIFNNFHDIYSGDFYNMEVGGPEVRNLELSLGGCQFSIDYSDDGRFYVDATKASKLQAYEENGTLYLKAVNTSNTWPDITNRQVILYIPVGYKFDEVEASLGAGLMYLGTVYADAIELNSGAGMISADYLEADIITAEVGAGDITISDMQVNTLAATVQAGMLSTCGDILKKAEVECSVGSANMEINGSRRDYNYDLGSAMGSILIDGMSSRQRQVDNGADRDIIIDCAVGSVSVSFTE